MRRIYKVRIYLSQFTVEDFVSISIVDYGSYLQKIIELLT